jgi:hypothetical protein
MKYDSQTITLVEHQIIGVVSLTITVERINPLIFDTAITEKQSYLSPVLISFMIII